MARLDWEKANTQEKAKGGREPRAMGPSVEWWWTLSPYASRCAGCGNRTAVGEQVAWNHDEGRALCRVCVEHEDLQPGESKRLRGVRQRAEREREKAKQHPVRAEIEAKRTLRGGWSRAQLAEWGVPWPPPKGWKKRLEQKGLPGV
jgi:hypothetical protein